MKKQSESEKKFLEEYDFRSFDRPAVTADIIAFSIHSVDSGNYKKDDENRLSVLLVKRGDHPDKGCWSLPGGFIDSAKTIEECAADKIRAKTNIFPETLVPIGSFSDPERDPRGRVISNAFITVISENENDIKKGENTDETQWFSVTSSAKGKQYITELTGESEKITCICEKKAGSLEQDKFNIVNDGGLAFDHAAILTKAIGELRRMGRDFERLFDFLPEKFTLTKAQKVSETISGVHEAAPNFRRKIEKFVTETEEYDAPAGHRPAKLFRRKSEEPETEQEWIVPTKEERKEWKQNLYDSCMCLSSERPEFRPYKRDSLEALLDSFFTWAEEYNDGYFPEKDDAETDRYCAWLVQEWNERTGN